MTAQWGTMEVNLEQEKGTQLTHGALPLHHDASTTRDANKRDLVLWRVVRVGVKNAYILAIKLVL